MRSHNQPSTPDVFVHPRFDGVYRQHPIVLVDVGARGGLRSHWRPAERHLRVIGFEPDAREYARLVQSAPEGGTVRWFNRALHSHPGRIELQIARDAGLSSIYGPNRAFLDAFPDAGRFDIVDRQAVEAMPLDGLLADANVEDVDFLKIDTQGSELSIIEGAGLTLSRSGLGVEVEVEFAPMYEGQPLFAQVDTALRAHGYSLFDLRPCYWKRAAGRMLGGPKGQIVWADALYLRDTPALMEAVALRPSGARTAKVLKAISIAVLYGYWDYALAVAEAARAVVGRDELATIVDSLQRGGRRAHDRRNIPGRHAVAAVLRRLLRLATPAADGWSYGGAKLGND